MRTLKSYNDYHRINESVNMADINSIIDYTQLDPAATEDMIIQLCENADKLGVKSVCVLPKMVSIAAKALVDSKVLVCTVVSFPEGTDSLEQKVAECKKVIGDGADEVDMVITPIVPEILDDENFMILVKEVESLVDVCHINRNKDGGYVVLKVIVESGLLNTAQTSVATEMCLEAGADFIKTSTGKVSVGAEINKVKIMKNVISKEDSVMKIKASGGIRTLDDVDAFSPYVDRLGIGYGSVDTMNGIDSGVKSNY